MTDGIFSVLIVDDNTNNLQVIASVLEDCNYEIGFAMSGTQAIDYIKLEKPDLVLLDVMMPGMDGYQTCSILKSDPEFSDIPIIFLTAKVETEDIIKGFEVGGVDYISKPFNSAELKSRVKIQLQLKEARDKLKKSIDELQKAKDLIEKQNEKLNEMMKELEIYSNKDPLTSLANRRSMIEAMINEIKNVESIHGRFSLAMGDIDLFKKINDAFGHDGGDEVLKTLSNIFSSSIKNSDFVSRWGGEEFLIMLTNAGEEESSMIIEKIRKTINDYAFDFDGVKETITMTFGLSEYRFGDTIDDVIKRADTALYEGKRSGRNKVILG